MKKYLFVLFALLVFELSAQSLHETFEQSEALPQGWVVRNVGDQYKWQVIKYDEDPNLKTIKGFTHGGNNLLRVESGRVSGESPDSWLITPQVKVGKGEYLNFMLSYNGSFNGNFNVEKEFSTKFEILVSETGTDADDFKTILLSLDYQNLCNWNQYSIDLSSFAGKKIYIAFREYGKGKSLPYLKNVLFLDNISIDTYSPSDLSLISMTSPISGCTVDQEVKVVVSNVGKAIDSFDMSYQVDEDPIVTEHVIQTIGKGETIDYTFEKKALLQRGKSHTIKAWLTSASDTNKDNDTIKNPAEIFISDEMPFPFEMNVENAQTYFHAEGAKPIGNVVYGWAYGQVGPNIVDAWCWTYGRRIKSSLVSNCMLLPQGDIMMRFEYKSLVSGDLEVRLIDDHSKSEIIIGKNSFDVSEDFSAANMLLKIPSPGLYRISISPSAEYRGQIFVKGIKLSEIFEDISISKVVAPLYNAYPVNSTVPVSAVFKYIGSNTLNNVTVCYQLDNNEPVKEFIPKLSSGNSFVYTFAKQITLANLGNHTLKVWCDYNKDKDRSNDIMKADIYAYKPVSFPYKTSFENESDTKNWVLYNPDGDLIKWEFMEVIDKNINFAKDGKVAAYISSIAGVEHNDWLISPQIILPKGKVRVSFYYVTRMMSKDPQAMSKLSVYLSKTSDTGEIINLKPSSVSTITNDNVGIMTQGYSLLDVPQEGEYYISIYNSGMGHDIILDDVRIDKEDDMCVVGASNSEKSGFNLKDNAFTIYISNHGANTVRNVPVSFEVNDGQKINEVYSSVINPGDTVSYTFNSKCNLAKTDFSYIITGHVLLPSDSDPYNNQWVAPVITHFSNGMVPYVANFDDPISRAKWTLDAEWITGDGFQSANSAYDGNGAIAHLSSATKSSGDWAFSGCIFLKKGTYDFSFFYRTLLNMSNASEYGQSFEVFIGKEPTISAMTKSLAKFDNVTVSVKQYQKYLTDLIITEDGNYYIGVKCSTTNDKGCIYLDDFEINNKVVTGIILHSPYQSDFSKDADQWYHYNPALIFQQWVLKKDNGVPFMQVQRAGFDFTDLPTELPGYLVAPAFYFEKNDVIDFSFDYSLEVDHPDYLDEQEKNKIKIGLYLADRNIPDAFNQELGVGTNIDGKRCTVSGRFKIEKNGVYYIGFLADGQRKSLKETVISTYRIYNLKLRDINRENIIDVKPEKVFEYIDDSINFMVDYKCAKLYNMMGQVVLECANRSTMSLNGLDKGVYILKIDTGNESVISKISI